MLVIRKLCCCCSHQRVLSNAQTLLHPKSEPAGPDPASSAAPCALNNVFLRTYEMQYSHTAFTAVDPRVDWRARAVSLLKSMHEARAAHSLASTSSATNTSSTTAGPVDNDPSGAPTGAHPVTDLPLPMDDLVKLQLWKQTSLSKRFHQLEQDANDVMHAMV